MKYCPKCDTSKNNGDFHSNKSRFDNLSTYCKLCHNKWTNNHQKAIRSGAKKRGRWEEATEDKQDMPTKACGGCGDTVSHLVTMPGQLVTINEAWWHIPCYNKATKEAKKAATQAVRDAWAEIQVKWLTRQNRHSTGAPGSEKHNAALEKRLGPVRFQQLLKKRERNAGTARARMARMKLISLKQREEKALKGIE